MGFGMSQVVGPRTSIDDTTLAVMYKYMSGIDVALLRRGDIDSFCQALFVHVEHGVHVCGGSFPLFDRWASANDTDFLGCADTTLYYHAIRTIVLVTCLLTCLLNTSVRIRGRHMDPFDVVVFVFVILF